MRDIISLLPDALANQIAAGEVVQRPASVVKELMENAIDAGATNIQLIVKEGGRQLIQVIDDGCGMSVTDARLSFERHATSKIKQINDLFAITTFGFRGEALASIAAVAQVEMTSRRAIDDLGTKIVIEGSEVKEQVPVNAPFGTNFQVKNLFFNVPARRNFLKSNTVEFRHINEEFTRVALAHPELSLKLNHNGTDVFVLKPAVLKLRIMALLGNYLNPDLVPVEEQSSILNVTGFIGKPRVAKKSRGDQYFFVNNRFIKDAYLNHAVVHAFEGLLPQGAYPIYVLFLTLDAAKIDINVHPTKTEIKFDDERPIYAILQSAVKKALSKYNVAPSIDFDADTSFSGIYHDPIRNPSPTQPAVKYDVSYNPFPSSPKEKENDGFPQHFPQNRPASSRGWEELYAVIEKPEPEQQQMAAFPSQQPEEQVSTKMSGQPLFQLHNLFILAQIKSGFILVDQNAAHQRILFERFRAMEGQRNHLSQQTLFPETIEFSIQEAIIVEEILPQLQVFGFDIRPLGRNAFVVHGMPLEIEMSAVHGFLHELINQFKNQNAQLAVSKFDQIVIRMAVNAAIKPGKPLNETEMQTIIDELFACEMPYYTPEGKQTIVTITLEELKERFK